jgi:hypothetical protein
MCKYTHSLPTEGAPTASDATSAVASNHASIGKVPASAHPGGIRHRRAPDSCRNTGCPVPCPSAQQCAPATLDACSASVFTAGQVPKRHYGSACTMTSSVGALPGTPAEFHPDRLQPNAVAGNHTSHPGVDSQDGRLLECPSNTQCRDNHREYRSALQGQPQGVAPT